MKKLIAKVIERLKQPSIAAAFLAIPGLGLLVVVSSEHGA